MRQKHRFHGLKAYGVRMKIRASWNKYNLYNLQRMSKQSLYLGTHYQEKWQAKSLTRAYHGEYVREKQWQKMFRPFTRAVIPFNPEQLAQHDGSEQAAGRGSGKEERDSKGILERRGRIPYMSMVYAPLERRLDLAVFRALFASSARQARQFVVHGAVKVNGKKMIYPGYLLNPGDMFQVDPERVLYATGAFKERFSQRARRAVKREQQRQKAKAQKQIEEASAEKDPEEPAESANSTALVPLQEPKQEDSLEGQTDSMLRKKINKKKNEALKKVKHFYNHGVAIKALSAKRKQDIRALIKEIKTICDKFPVSEFSTLDSKLAPLLAQVEDPQETRVFRAPEEPESEDSEPNAYRVGRTAELDAYEKGQRARIIQRMEELRENPHDPSKPYATPWQPRPYMAPFVFIPRYLEVNQKVCAAVYLRHPQARPGLSEVPSPFGPETQQLAFTWYLRRK